MSGAALIAHAFGGAFLANAVPHLTSGRFADHNRSLEWQWREAGIRSVPAVIINETYLISGGRPADAFERALRTIAAEI